MPAKKTTTKKVPAKKTATKKPAAKTPQIPAIPAIPAKAGTGTGKKASGSKKSVAKKSPAKKNVKPASSKASAGKSTGKKADAVVKEAPKAKANAEAPKGEYYYANGKRKSSVARVRLYAKGKGEITVNNRGVNDYFPVFTDQDKIHSPLRLTENLSSFDITVRVVGGGIQSQAEAVRHGIAKALVLFKPEFRSVLKQAMFLRRDSRIKERKKFGLKRARRAPQWSKR